jgi:anti-sigma regulatory factor (Ser/Thr protein kinase)
VIRSGEQARNRQSSQLELELRPGADAPAMARAAVRELCEQERLARADCQTLLLLVSEIVTNAVLHSNARAGTPIHFLARVDDGTVRIEVFDGGSGFTQADAVRARGGWGLRLVAKEAHRWGVDDGRGTHVWFELGLE